MKYWLTIFIALIFISGCDSSEKEESKEIKTALETHASDGISKEDEEYVLRIARELTEMTNDGGSYCPELYSRVYQAIREYEKCSQGMEDISLILKIVPGKSPAKSFSKIIERSAQITTPNKCLSTTKRNYASKIREPLNGLQC